MNAKTNRNDLCPCGSGKKYKQCCQAREQQTSNTQLLNSVPELFKQALKLLDAGKLDKAEEIYQRILTISPKHTETLYQLGKLVLKSGRAELAINLLRKAIQLEPSSLHYSSLAYALTLNAQHEEAIVYYHKAIALNPGDSTIYNNLGLQLSTIHRYGEAIFFLQKSIALNPRQDAALGNLAICLMRQGHYNEAINYFLKAIKINPAIALYYHNLLFCLCFDREAFANHYIKEARRLDVLLNSRASPYRQWTNATHAFGQPLRVGLVTGDLRNHPVGFFLESIAAHLDPSKIQFVAYSTQSYEDSLTARIKPHFFQWTPIANFSDQQAAQKIHDDGIHILIDLAGHTADNKLSVFAWRPAPVQVSWLGYFASTGLSCMDYFIADPMSVPQANMSHFTETVRYLPHTRLCFTPPANDINQDVSPLPAIKNGFVTFGCFQSSSKINHKMITLWAAILKECPTSHLLFKNHSLKDSFSKQELINKLAAADIPIERITLEEGSSRDQYLAAYDRVDFMLDTFPFPGGTTTCEALWMGVPTLTLSGMTLLERQGMSMLHCVGLDEWIAIDETDYINKAVYFAKHKETLSQLRITLRQTMLVSPLVDAVHFSKDFENLLFSLWRETHDNPL